MSNLPDIVWRPTWDDHDKEDYTAWDGDRRIGRIYTSSLSGETFWQWFPGWAGQHGLNKVASRREAMVAIEDAYLDLLSKHPDPDSLFPIPAHLRR